MSKRKTWARASAIAVARWIGSLYALGFTFLFGDENPPRAAQIDAACGVARYLISASDAGVSLNMTTMSPPPITAGLDPLIDGNANWLKPVIGFSGFFEATTPGTKSTSSTIAAFGFCAKSLLTEVGKSVCSAPDVPPAMLPESPRTCAIALSAAFTDTSVHLSVCEDSLSYLAGPAVR